MLAGLGGSDDRMFGGARVFGRVPVRRAITAECDAALLTRAQMYPLRADLHAFSAFAVLRLLNRRDRVEMRTTSVRHLLKDFYRRSLTKRMALIGLNRIRMISPLRFSRDNCIWL